MEQVKIIIPSENPVKTQSLPQQVRPSKNHEGPPLLKLKLLLLLDPSVQQKLVKIQCLHIQIVLVNWQLNQR